MFGALALYQPVLNTAHSGFLPQGASILSHVTGDDGIGTDDAMVVGISHSESLCPGGGSSGESSM